MVLVEKQTMKRLLATALITSSFTTSAALNPETVRATNHQFKQMVGTRVDEITTLDSMFLTSYGDVATLNYRMRIDGVFTDEFRSLWSQHLTKYYSQQCVTMGAEFKKHLPKGDTLMIAVVSTDNHANVHNFQYSCGQAN
ncbi:hypothetical protein JCM19240_4337 [Vibrio maritimus]|uniref:Uncharacterized protein n=1 Tax=Vibrio maritimus TaxID=990268 RepID=A0A090TUW9_9VIBR|nr:hypothetical protein JCM19240_4337 [Vibrio maritimus]